jgi:hypothetical protein
LLSKNTKIKAYITTVLPVVLYGCETWSLTFWEECRLGVFKNRVLRRIIGPKRDEVTGEWRKLHNEKLYDLYSLPNVIQLIKSRRMRWAGHVASTGEKRGSYSVLVGKLD